MDNVQGASMIKEKGKIYINTKYLKVALILSALGAIYFLAKIWSF